MSKISSILAGFKKVFVAIGHGFAAIFGKQQAQDFGNAALEILKTDLGKIAMTTVESIAAIAPALDNATARAQAFTAIKNAALSNGIDAKDSIINLLIELAVQFVKGHFTVTDANLAPTPAPANPADVAPVTPLGN